MLGVVFGTAAFAPREFSWIEWPDKPTRDAGMKSIMSDPRFSPDSNPMPFDGKRMIFGGFAPVVVLDS